MKKLTVLLLSIVGAVAMMTSCLTPEQQIEKAIKKVNEQCPMDVGNGMTIASLTIEDNNIVYLFEIDETQGMSVQIFNMPEVKDAMKKTLVEQYLNEDNKDTAPLTKLCKEADYNLVFRFAGKPSGDEAEIVVNADEL